MKRTVAVSKTKGFIVVCLSFLGSGKVYKLFSTNENTYVSNTYSPLPKNEAIWSLVSFVSLSFLIIIIVKERK